MRRRLARLVVIVALCAPGVAGSSSGEIAAVVSATLPVRAVTAEQLADIYLGRSNRFPDGTPATPCDLAEGSPLREAFYRRVIGKTHAQMKAHWSKLIFTGRGQPPREVANSEEAKRLVIERPGTVCYIERALVDSRVTVLLMR